MTERPPGRPRVNGEGRKKKLFVRSSTTFEFKSELVRYFRECCDVQLTLARFFPGLDGTRRESKRKRIYYWARQHEYIERCASDAALSRQQRVRPLGLGTTLPPDAELVLVEWIADLRREGVPVAAVMLQLRAREVGAEYGVPSGSFGATWEWRRGFLKRHALSFRAQTHAGQQTPAYAMEAARQFAASVRATMEIEGITRVFNANQTGVFFEYLPRRTVDESGATTVWVKCGKKQKERLTAMVLGSSAGVKYPLFVIIKTVLAKTAEAKAENERLRHGFGKRLWKEISDLQNLHSVQIYGNSSAWWNGYMTIEFLRFRFGHRTPLSAPILLLLDGFSGHWVAAVVDYARALSIVLMKIPPPGLTWVSQPADVAWIKPIKDRLRQQWVDFLYDQLQTHRKDSYSSRFQLVPPSRANAVQWISAAWGGIASTTITAGFRRCVFDSSSGDDSDDARDDEATQHRINEAVDEFRAMHLLDSQVGDLTSVDDVLNEQSK